jgi:hypothetical protein
MGEGEMRTYALNRLLPLSPHHILRPAGRDLFGHILERDEARAGIEGTRDLTGYRRVNQTWIDLFAVLRRGFLSSDRLTHE